MGVALWLALQAAGSVQAAAPPAIATPLVVKVGETIPVTVNGIPGRALVDPDDYRLPHISPEFAARAKIASRQSGSALIGPVKVKGRVGTAWLGVPGGRSRQMMAWYPAPFGDEADILVGPSSLPYRTIRFELGPKQPGERRYLLPATDFGWQGLGLSLRAGKAPIKAFFNLWRETTLATAGGGTVLAAAFEGRLEGAPQPMPISLGVARPVQRMRFAEPIEVGPLVFSTIGVRLADFGRTRATAAGDDETDEVTITAKSERDSSHDRLAIGRDALSRCSSLTVDRRERTFTLSCLPPPSPAKTAPRRTAASAEDVAAQADLR